MQRLKRIGSILGLQDSVMDRTESWAGWRFSDCFRLAVKHFQKGLTSIINGHNDSIGWQINGKWTVRYYNNYIYRYTIIYTSYILFTSTGKSENTPGQTEKTGKIKTIFHILYAHSKSSFMCMTNFMGIWIAYLWHIGVDLEDEDCLIFSTQQDIERAQAVFKATGKRTPLTEPVESFVLGFRRTWRRRLIHILSVHWESILSGKHLSFFVSLAIPLRKFDIL